MTYTQLTQEQRYQIYALKKMQHSQSASLEQSASTAQPFAANYSLIQASVVIGRNKLKNAH